MLSPARRRFLEDLFPGEQSLFDPPSLLVHGVDACRKGELPAACVRPREEAQMAELLRWAQAERVPIVPRARGTNTVGDCVPPPEAVVVSTTFLDRVLEMDANDYVAVAEPGVVVGELQKRLEAEGLFYPPDPASARFSTLGGNVATCAGGMRALKYGVTRDHVLGLRVVLPGGEVIQTGSRAHKNVVGLDLTRLMVGSAGTLGLFSRIMVKCLPLPPATASCLGAFPTLEDALAGARDVFRAGLLPAALEFMGRGMCAALADLMPVPWPMGAASPEGVLLVRLDGTPEALTADIRRVEAAFAPHAPMFLETAQGQAEERFWEVRRNINPASFRAGSLKLSDDVTLPRGKLGQALRRFDALGAEAGVRVLHAGHLGDGNLHVSVMHEPGQEAAAARVKAGIQETSLALGGSLSGEHGIGLVKREAVGRQLGREELRLMRGIKAVFDPCNIMNPGKGF